MNDLPKVSETCLMLGQNAMSPNRFSGKSQGAQPDWGLEGACRAVERACRTSENVGARATYGSRGGPSAISPRLPANLHVTSGITHMFCTPKGPCHTCMHSCVM